jgi:DNA repair protein RecO (recombination protein O)
MAKRVQQEPGYVLHHRPFRDSSQILDLLTRDHGRIAVVARGSRGGKSRLAGVLRPFMPLRVSWVAKTDLGTLTGAESAGPPAGLRGDALLSAFYVNELMLNFLHRDDPQPEVFALYAQTVSDLNRREDVAPALREFEMEFLGLLGYALNLDHEGGGNEPIEAQRHYDYRVEQGPVPVQREEGSLVFDGATLQGIAARRFDDPEVLRGANRLLRAVIAYHLGGKELQSRKVLRDVHRGRIAPPESADKP